MDHYVDIRLRPDPEFTAAHLMNALFAKLHRALVQLGSSDIGVSFPETANGRIGLGTLMRLHGRDQSLRKLMALQWLGSMNDHAHTSDARPVPVTVEYHSVRRVQAKSNPERLRRRQMKRKSWTAEQAIQAIPDSATETLHLPYLTVRSQSTGQSFRLFVSQRRVASESSGEFSTYGFSATATLPQF